MYDYLDDNNQVSYGTIGSFDIAHDEDFKNGVKTLLESFSGGYQVDGIADIGKILKVDTLKESYKEMLLGDVVTESFQDQYFDTHPEKLEQLFENSSLQIVKESSVGVLNPVVGLSLPVLKKNYLECHAKDIVMTEVPVKPIIKTSFERKFLKDKEGNKYYIPEIFYDDSYKKVLDKSRGKAICADFFPKEGGQSLPIQDLPILNLSGGTMELRDSLAYDFCVKAVQMEVDGETKTVNVNVIPDKSNNGAFTCRIKVEGKSGEAVEDILVGEVDYYYGKVSVACTGGKIKKVQFGGHLSNENNYETVELDRERENMTWEIPDGQRINTGLTLEKIKDYKALANIDLTADIINDMSTVLTQFEDSSIFSFLDDSLEKWRDVKELPFGYADGFVEAGEFSCIPDTSHVTPSEWVEKELKSNLNLFVNSLKEKLKTKDIMFTIYGHPNLITLITDDVRWIINEDTKVGGIQLDYRFGVMTKSNNRIHVVSTLKSPVTKGLRVIAQPLTKDTITFKHYKYSLNIENIYQNPFTPLVPNVMGTSRHLTTEVLPVQGEFLVTDVDHGYKKKAKGRK